MLKKFNHSSKMHRVVILTDLHLRADYMPGYLKAQLDTLKKLVNKKPPDSVVINGDIFHRRNPKGQELLAFRSLLEDLQTKNIYINRGNHDTVAKDGSTDTTLSLYKDIATVIDDYQQVRLGGVTFDFIPHYEDEEKIKKCLRATDNPVFGHFGFDGCESNGHYSYESYVKKKHFKKRFVFLGHIHKPQIFNKRVYILGTQYSTSFGEANTQKYIHELIIRNGNIEVIRKPINFGIRHVVCTLDDFNKIARKYNFPAFFTILRLKLDTLDEGTESELTEKLLKEHNIEHLEIVFEDMLPKYDPSYVDSDSLLTVDEKIIEEYIDNSSTIFSQPELLEALEEIKRYET